MYSRFGIGFLEEYFGKMILKKATLFLTTIFLIGITISPFTLTASDLDVAEDKFEPWLWDNIQELEANGTSRIVSLIVQLIGSIETLKNQAADLLLEFHGAEDIWGASTFPTIIAKVNSTEVKAIAAYDFVKLLGDGENPKYTFSVRKATLREPLWNFSGGTVDFTLCNEGSRPFTIADVTINGNKADTYPSSVSLSPGEKAKILIYYPFKPDHKYTFILIDDIGHMHRSYHSTHG